MNWNIFNVLVLLGAIQGVFLGLILILNKRYKAKTNIYLAMLLISMSLTNFEYWIIDTKLSKINFFLEHFFIPFQHLITPMLFIYTSYYIGDAQSVKKFRVLFYMPFTFFSLGHIFLMFYYFSLTNYFVIKKEHISQFYLTEEIVSILFSIFFIYKIFHVLKRYKGLKIKSNKVDISWIKKILYFAIGIAVFWSLSALLGVYNNNSIINYLLWISVSFVIYWIGFSGLNQHILYKEIDSVKNLSDKIKKQNKKRAIEKNKTYNIKNPTYEKLNSLIEQEKLYKNSEISLDYIASRLKISSGYLSQLINRIVEKSFSEYINYYRVEEVKKMLLNQEFDKYSILSLGYEAGFNSKSVFYTAFKKQTELTPKQFKDKNRYFG